MILRRRCTGIDVTPGDIWFKGGRIVSIDATNQTGEKPDGIVVYRDYIQNRILIVGNATLSGVWSRKEVRSSNDKTLLNGTENTKAIIEADTDQTIAAWLAYNYYQLSSDKGKWFLPSFAEGKLYENITEVNSKRLEYWFPDDGYVNPIRRPANRWSSTEFDQTQAWRYGYTTNDTNAKRNFINGVFPMMYYKFP